VRAVPCLCEFFPGICLTTEEKARKNLSQGKKNLSQVKKNLSQSTVYILPKHPHKHTHYKNPHIHTHTHTHTHTYITKQYKTTTVQIKTNTVQDIPKWNSHNTIKYPQYKVTLMYIPPLSTWTFLLKSYWRFLVYEQTCAWDLRSAGYITQGRGAFPYGRFGTTYRVPSSRFREE